jgi:hypothetical protein
MSNMPKKARPLTAPEIDKLRRERGDLWVRPLTSQEIDKIVGDVLAAHKISPLLRSKMFELAADSCREHFGFWPNTDLCLTVIAICSGRLGGLDAKPYTPGPWGIEPTCKLNGVAEYIIAAPDSSLPNIASVTGRPGESSGNAYIIAHAPDMLEVLECIVANADADCVVPLDDLMDAKNIIAKAKGENPNE